MKVSQLGDINSPKTNSNLNQQTNNYNSVYAERARYDALIESANSELSILKNNLTKLTEQDAICTQIRNSIQEAITEIKAVSATVPHARDRLENSLKGSEISNMLEDVNGIKSQLDASASSLRNEMSKVDLRKKEILEEIEDIKTKITAKSEEISGLMNARAAL